jgi:alanine racemase
MADFLPAEREALLEHRLTPAIHSLEDLRQFDRLAARRGLKVPYHLKVDTGMGRLGTRANAVEVLEAVTAARHTWLEGLMTHFASAALYNSRQTDEQIARFRALAEGLAAGGIEPEHTHLSATIPVAYGRREAWGTMVRPGHAIYGYVSPLRGPVPSRALHVRPALDWKASILEVKELPEGAPVGYGAMFWTNRRTRAGILAVGYADGFPHRLSNKGQVIAGGRLVPVLGAVSMDLTTVDLTDCPELNAGDAVTLLGEESGARIDAQQIARLAGTISYSVLCGISARVKRVYR